MYDTEDIGLNDSAHLTQPAEAPRPRAVGSPLPMGTGGRAAQAQGDSKRFTPARPPGRALAGPSPEAGEAEQSSSSLQRAVSALRLALPFVQRILPLLDGQIVTAVTNVLIPRPQAPSPTRVNLAPIEEGLTELQTQHRQLRDQVVEQNSSLKRVEDQLEMVREATDRNTLEQQELLEDLKHVGAKLKIVALAVFALLTISILLNVILYLHIHI